MRCIYCDTEMFVERQGEGIIHKCPNPVCTNFGYKEAKKEGEDE